MMCIMIKVTDAADLAIRQPLKYLLIIVFLFQHLSHFVECSQNLIALHAESIRLYMYSNTDCWGGERDFLS